MRPLKLLVLLAIALGCSWIPSGRGWDPTDFDNFRIDYYRTLGVEKSAPAAKIKKAYKTLALEWHPDKSDHPDAAQIFIRLQKAYEVLKDKKSRNYYDSYFRLHQKVNANTKYYSPPQYNPQPKPKPKPTPPPKPTTETIVPYKDTDVVEITGANFNDLISDGLWFVMYEKTDMEEGVEMRNMWTKFATSVRSYGHVGSVNCKRSKAMCKQFGIEHYPTFIAYKDGRAYFYEDEPPVSRGKLESFFHRRLNNPVQYMEEEKFRATVQTSMEPWLVMFVSQTCDECPEMVPDFRVTGTILKDIVDVGLVDCTFATKLCSELGIVSYPTFILFENWMESTSTFTGHVKSREIAEWALDSLTPPHPVEAMQTEFGFRKTVLSSSEPWVVVFTDPSTKRWPKLRMDFDRTAYLLRRRHSTAGVPFRVGFVDCSAPGMASLCTGKYSVDTLDHDKHVPTIHLFPRGAALKSSPLQFDSEMHGWKTDNLIEFAKQHEVPSIEDLSLQTMHVMPNKGKDWALIFCANNVECAKVRVDVQRLVDNMGLIYNFATANCQMQPDLCNRYSVTSYPSMRLHASLPTPDTGKKSLTILNFDGSTDPTAFFEWLSYNMKLRSPDVAWVPEQNFLTRVYETEKPVLVVFTTGKAVSGYGSCEKCQALELEIPIIQAALSDKLEIIRVDCDEHRSFCYQMGVTQVPATHVYPQSKELKQTAGFSVFHSEVGTHKGGLWSQEFLAYARDRMQVLS